MLNSYLCLTSFLYCILLLFCLSIFIFQNTDTERMCSIDTFIEPNPFDTLCLYAYFEKDSNCIDNLMYFLNHGSHETNIHYIIIVNGSCSIDIDKHAPTVTVIFRENVGYDFGGYTYAVENVVQASYKYYMFLNSSVRGPFGCSGDDRCVGWQNKFLKLLSNEVKLVGTTINVFELGAHVQSMFFVMDSDCFNFLKYPIFSSDHATLTMEDTIGKKEIYMSTLVLRNGWNISCTAALYQGYDYRHMTQDFNFSSRNGDPHYEGAYFGGTVNRDEIVFIKTNRGLHNDG